MLSAIAGASQSIALTSYIFRNDAAGNDFAGALIAARARGVTVRVLLDSVGVGYIFPRIYYRLRAGGVAAARFLHTWLPWAHAVLLHAEPPQSRWWWMAPLPSWAA